MRRAGISGQLTIFFGMIMVIILSLTVTLIEGTRYSALKVSITGTHHVAANSVLAGYHREVFDRYGILLFDSTRVESQIKEVIEENWSKDLIGEVLNVRDLLAPEVVDVKLEHVTLATDEKGKVLWRQGVLCVEEKYGISYLERALELFGYVEEQGLTAAEPRLPAGEEEITKEELQEALAGVDLEKTGIPDTFDWLEREALAFLVGQKEYSQQSLPLQERVSEREMAFGAGPDKELGFEENSWNKLLFIEYLLDVTGNYVCPLEEGLLQYQTEYLLHGREIDADNLWETAKRLLELRTGANLLGIFMEEERSAAVKEVSATLASAIGNPEAEPLIYAALLLIWAEAEGIYDVKMILNGEGVSLLKTPDEWLLNMTWLSEIASQSKITEEDWQVRGEGVVSDAGAGTKLFYKDYLRILLWLEEEENLTLRFMDIVESDIKQITGDADFCLNHYGDRMWLHTEVESKYGKEFAIDRVYGY